MEIKKTIFNKLIYISLALLLVFSYFFFSGQNASQTEGLSTNTQTTVTMEGDKQIINISVRGGYFPNKIDAKANLPTIIRMTTKNTFDCSTALVIPKLNYRKNLPVSGITDINVPVQIAGSSINGTCSMGMYSFQIKFN